MRLTAFAVARARAFTSIASVVRCARGQYSKAFSWKRTLLLALLLAPLLPAHVCRAESKFEPGIGIHASPGVVDGAQLISQVKALGSTTFRVEYPWAWVEQHKGQLRVDPGLDALIRQAAAEGLRPLLVLSGDNEFYDGGRLPVTEGAQIAFAEYATFLAGRYKGIVHRYEVWSEWTDTAASPARGNTGDPVAYANLLSKVYMKLKAIDADLIVSGGAMLASDRQWINSLFQAGALANLDALSVRSYNYPNAPEQSVQDLQALEAAAKAANSGKQIPLYVTEIGWPTSIAQAGVDPTVAANFLARFYLLAPQLGDLKAAWWHELQDQGIDSSLDADQFGLLLANGSPKPAGCAMRELTKLLAQYQPKGATRDASGIWTAKFSDGMTSVFAVWKEAANAIGEANISSVEPSGLRIDAREICLATDTSDSGSTLLRTTISGAPVLFTTNADNISVQWGKASLTTRFGKEATAAAAAVSAVPENASAADKSSVIATAAATAPATDAAVACPCSLWPATATPAVTAGTEAAPAVELGVKLRVDVNGAISGIRFYKSTGNTGQHVANLWSADGRLLASALFTSETTSGWQQVNFPAPIPVVAGTTYVASYHTNTGHYSVNVNYFATSGVDNGPLHALKEGVNGANGVFAYGATSAFPASSYKSSNYWVDVVFVAQYSVWPASTVRVLWRPMTPQRWSWA